MGEERCPNHPGMLVQSRCSSCQNAFCSQCVFPTDMGPLCAACGGAPKGRSTCFIVAIVLGVLCFFCLIGIVIVAAIAIPNLVQAKKRGNEAAAIGALKTITTSEAVFREGDKDQNGVLDYGSLKQLGEANLIDAVLAGGTKQGYYFECRASTTTSEFLWWAVARPVIPGTSGDRMFYTNSSGVIFYCLFAGGEHDPGLPNPSTCELPTGLMPIGR